MPESSNLPSRFCKDAIQKKKKKRKKAAYVVFGHGAFALEHLDEHTRLVVRVGGESLAGLGGDGRVALDQRRHHSSRRLDTERQRRHVEQQQILHGLALVAGQNGRLHG